MGKKTAKERQQKAASGGTVATAVPLNPTITVLTLEDGTELPVGRLEGMTDEQYMKVLEHLRNNPEIARQQAEKAQKMMITNPMMAQAIMAQQKVMANPEFAKGLEVLKEDPELKEMFSEIKTKGPEALAKYWDDTETMSKIAKKMAALKTTEGPPKAADGDKGKEAAKPAVKAVTVETIHDAAKVGDVQVVLRFVDSDPTSVNSRDARGIAPLGVAVGFNRLEAIKALLAAGADPNATDSQGNSPMHYACGYGRREAAELLLGGGADAALQNKAGQTPLAVAELNKEKELIKFMKEWVGGGAQHDAFL